MYSGDPAAGLLQHCCPVDRVLNVFWEPWCASLVGLNLRIIAQVESFAGRAIQNDLDRPALPAVWRSAQHATDQMSSRRA